jgi:hypothetical protein
MSTADQKPLALTAFLSHKYKATAVNEFFFQLCGPAADIQFDVDVGDTTLSVTRLERLIRDADAFLGIYPLDSADPNPSTQTLLEASKYFRVELDIAARARKPGLIFRDERYRQVLSVSPPICEVPFNAQEIVSRGAKPSSAKFTRAFEAFCRRVAAEQQYELEIEDPASDSDRVGILLPRDAGPNGYSSDQVEIIVQAIRDAQYKPEMLDWPPLITPSWTAQIGELNWIALDIGPATVATGIVGYLHGAFKPAMRLCRTATLDEASSTGPTGLALYDGFEVGYRKDVIRWCDSETLAKGLEQRLSTLHAGQRRMSTLEEALQYFREAALRKEAVFVSYAGADEKDARNIRDAFRKKFQQVFDYRDGTSIRPGQPWLQEIFEQLSKCAVGVPLLSSAYLASGNCMHEFRDMIARVDDKKMQLFAIKLKADDQFTLPPESASLQYSRFSEYSTAEDLVDWITTNIKT